MIGRDHHLMQSMFSKLMAFFICFGMIPLALISMAFFFWYYQDVMRSTESNYSQIADYLARNVSGLLSKADGVAGYLYDYSTKDYDFLYQLLEAEEISEMQRKGEIERMLRDMLLADPDISSVRFYVQGGAGEDGAGSASGGGSDPASEGGAGSASESGACYMAFRAQGKTPRDGAQALNAVEMTPEAMHKMTLMPAVSEEAYYTNSTDRVFSVVRSYMKTVSVRAAQEECMGTLYIDIEERAIARLTEDIDVGLKGGIAVLDPYKGQWLYEDGRGEMDGGLLRDSLKGDSEIIRSGKNLYFCRRILGTGYYVVIQIFTQDVADTYIKSSMYLMAFLLLTILLLTMVYVFFSGKVSGPVRKLTLAMRQLQKGNLDARVEIHTNDEMAYLGEGFNRMARDLTHYIEEVYVAKVRQKEAELNALKMQIQPHYLYNTLDVIRMTAVENGDAKTARLLEGLGKQLRYVMGQQGERVPLYMELDSIQGYLVLMNARYQDRLHVNVYVSDQDRRLHVLKLLLQPVIENCIKHGLRGRQGPGAIEIRAKRRDSCLEVTVMDDGVGMAPEQAERLKISLERKEPLLLDQEGHTGVGLKNVYDRIKFTCGEEYGFDVISVMGMGTMVKYRLPIWEEGAESGERCAGDMEQP